MFLRPPEAWRLWSSLAALAIETGDIGTMFVLTTRFDGRDGWLRAYA